jgi:hypothetical protein
LKGRINRAAVDSECHVGRHVEDQIIAFAGDINPGAGGLLTQLLFLFVHIIADTRSGESAKASADNFGGAIIAPAQYVAEQIAADNAAEAADGCL